MGLGGFARRGYSATEIIGGQVMDKTPWHISVVGIIALLWNGMGALDYVMTQTRNEAYMAAFTEEQLAFFYGFPAWTVAAWAIAVWGGVLAALLILARRAWAWPVMIASVLGMVVTSFHNFVLSDVSMAEIMGSGAAIFSGLIVLGAVLQLWYIAVQKRLGRLR